MIASFLRRSGIFLLRIRSDLRVLRSRFDWSVAKQPAARARENTGRKDTQRGHSQHPRSPQHCCTFNPQKESSLNHKRKFQRASRTDPSCKDEVGLIADYLAGRLNPTVLAPFEKHLGQCPDCTAFLNTYKKTIEATKSFLKLQSLNVRPKPLTLAPKGRELIASFIFWLHLFISSTYLTTG